MVGGIDPRAGAAVVAAVAARDRAAGVERVTRPSPGVHGEPRPASDGGGSSAVEVWVVTPAMDSREFGGGRDFVAVRHGILALQIAAFFDLEPRKGGLMTERTEREAAERELATARELVASPRLKPADLARAGELVAYWGRRLAFLDAAGVADDPESELEG